MRQKNRFTPYIDQFIEHLQVKHYSPATIRNYTNQLHLIADWLVKHKVTTVKNVTFKVLRKWHLDMLKQKCSQNTSYKKILVIKQFFSYLHENYVILSNPAANLVTPPKPVTLPGAVISESEMCKVLNAPGMKTPRGLRDTAIFELLYSTGIRREECLNLKVEDVDLQNAILRVNQGKGNKDRLLPIGNRAVEVLRIYLTEVRPFRTLSAFDSGRLFVNLSTGQPLSVVGLSRIMHIYTRKALKKPLGAHVFRRSFATHMLRNGADIISIQRMLGHSDSKSTMKYVRVSARDLKKAHAQSHPRERVKG